MNTIKLKCEFCDNDFDAENAEGIGWVIACKKCRDIKNADAKIRNEAFDLVRNSVANVIYTYKDYKNLNEIAEELAEYIDKFPKYQNY